MSGASLKKTGTGGLKELAKTLSLLEGRPWQPAQWFRYRSAPLTRFASVACSGFFSSGAWRSVEASTADMARCISVSLGGWSALKFMSPVFKIMSPARKIAARVAMMPRMNPFIRDHLRFVRMPVQSAELLYLDEPIVFLQDFAQFVVGQCFYDMTIGPNHRFRGDQRVDDRLLGGLHGGFEKRVHAIVGQHLNRHWIFLLHARAGICGGKRDKNIARTVSGNAAKPPQS